MEIEPQGQEEYSIAEKMFRQRPQAAGTGFAFHLHVPRPSRNRQGHFTLQVTTPIDQSKRRHRQVTPSVHGWTYR
jgi:hypothetical protein